MTWYEAVVKYNSERYRKIIEDALKVSLEGAKANHPDEYRQLLVDSMRNA